MTDYSLNTGTKEQDRSLVDMGFNGMEGQTMTPGQSKSSVPYDKPSPLTNDVNPSSNTEKGSVPTPSGDFARRTS